ncbi:MAG TPA: right-handed parallel beta-helix repeat-containing protein [Steroidobacteraceae bacterium]
MAIRGRPAAAIGLFVLLGALVALGHWYDTRRPQVSRSTQPSLVVHVTSPADRGPGSLREALFIVSAATGPGSISIEVPEIHLETALPPLVNGHGIRLVGQAPNGQIDARALPSGPVLDVSGPNTSIEGLTIRNCPAAAILIRALRFRLSASTVESCDVGVDVADNAGETLIERNRFHNDRVGVRFAAAGRNSAVVSNEFTGDKDAGLWAVRASSGAHDAVIGVHDNKFTGDGTGIVAGNISILVERNDFINERDADVHVVGAGTVIRGNRMTGGASMGIVAENARGTVIEDNELEGISAYGIMVRGSSNTLVQANRLHNCGYGFAFVLGDPHNLSTAVDNTIIEPKFNGIDVIGDSPILRRNHVLRAHAYALHVEDFQPATGVKVLSQPYLDDNDFGNTPVLRSGVALAAGAGGKR